MEQGFNVKEAPPHSVPLDVRDFPRGFDQVSAG